MTRVGVVLSGCGVNDGSEIHESVITMLALDRAGADIVFMAPNIDQLHVINHYTGSEMDESRNVLMESARIARGKIRDMAEVHASDVDALIFPGGFGVAKNLCDYAMAGTDCSVNPDVKRLATDVHKAEKPIGIICIAPAMFAKIMQGTGDSVEMTIGTDEQTSSDINSMGSNHITCSVEDIVIDKKNKVVSTPAYMLDQRISEVAEGIEKLVKEVLMMV
ncbi:MAG: isoprenoid biosynthesis glyoxalase ElbB [Candidatus Marinimicrobia bacterium]|jgi:enhancing lycopene biosynthesis protein 2|nr:isoprenoid biosynthesis glyoxalase ElbB [Candidatus Neomarinimicrobiota bacterium]|tara:strand:- start:240 stop:899 length:660 start_codon:yes stop_codon:yes gene_type:complete